MFFVVNAFGALLKLESKIRKGVCHANQSNSLVEQIGMGVVT
jgi:hypothetical protein